MQSITLKRSETELETEIQAVRRRRYRQLVSRSNGRRVEARDEVTLTSRHNAQDEKHAKRDVEYDDDHRHWSASSQPYAPADILFRYLRDGWFLGDKAIVQAVRCFSHRCVEVYYFRLTFGREYVMMPVIANPAVLRLVRERELVTIRLYADREISDLL